MNEKMNEGPLLIRVLEDLAKRFRVLVNASEDRGGAYMPTKDEHERDANRMQRQGRHEAWEDAERAVLAALEEHRAEAQQQELRLLRYADMLDQLPDLQAAIDKEPETIAGRPWVSTVIAIIQRLRAERSSALGEAAELRRMHAERTDQRDGLRRELKTKCAEMDVLWRELAVACSQRAAAAESESAEQRIAALEKQVAAETESRRGLRRDLDDQIARTNEAFCGIERLERLRIDAERRIAEGAAWMDQLVKKLGDEIRAGKAGT